MKKNLFILLMLFIAIQAKSNDYLELVKEGNKWNYLATSYTTCCGSVSNTYSLFLSGDTLIENVNYKRMLCERITVDEKTTLYVGAIREDIEEQSVYFRAKDSEEKNVYSFNYETGDTISESISSSGYEKTIRFAKSVETYDFGNYTGKKIIVCDTTYYEFPDDKWKNVSYYDVWYEGIGSNRLIFEFDESFYSDIPPLQETDLMCFWNNGTQVYQNPNFTFCEYAGTTSDIKENKNNLHIDIFPNPTKDILNIATDLEIKTVKIYNVVGNLLLESAQKTIDLSEFSRGIFIVKVILSSNESVEKKIVKR